MKESTKIILAYVGSAVAANMVLAGSVAGATSQYPRVAAAGEGAAALAGGLGAWRLKGKKRFVSAVAGGIGAGLLVDSIQSGALSAPPPKPGATAQGLPKTAPPPTGSTLPGPAAPIPVQGTTVAQLPGYTSVSGTVPAGSVIPTPNRPPTAQELAEYNSYLEQQLQQQQVAQAQMAQALQESSLPATQQDQGGVFGWNPFADQAGAAFRLGGTPKSRFGGMGSGFGR